MKLSRGVVYVAYGQAAKREAIESIKTLEEFCPDLPVTIITDQAIEESDWIPFGDPGPGARWAKLNIDLLSPYALTLYLDADTRILADVCKGFEMLEDGWDLVISPSSRQGLDVMGHLSPEDRSYTLISLECALPLQWQAGVMFFRRSKKIKQMFENWRKEWQEFRQQDQGALLRALSRTPVRIWTLSGDWNGGEIIEHKFGALRK